MFYKSLSINGKDFAVMGGFGDDIELCLTQSEIENAGSDLQEIFDWFRENGHEYHLVELWNESNYDPQFFTPRDIMLIAESQFSRTQDIQAAQDWLNGKPRRRQTLVKQKPNQKPRHGFVYLLHSNGVYKIGKALNLEARVLQISPVMPHPLELIHSIESDDYDQLELKLHNMFGHARLNGEWFNLSPTDVEYIRSL